MAVVKVSLFLSRCVFQRQEDAHLQFHHEKIADLAVEVNSTTENIGARRLHTLMEKLLEDILFAAPDIDEKEIVIDASFVENQLMDIVENEDLTRYIL